MYEDNLIITKLQMRFPFWTANSAQHKWFPFIGNMPLENMADYKMMPGGWAHSPGRKKFPDRYVRVYTKTISC